MYKSIVLCEVWSFEMSIEYEFPVYNMVIQFSVQTL